MYDSTFPPAHYVTFSQFHSEIQCVEFYGNNPF